MKPAAFFRRSDLSAALWAFRSEFWLVALFSATANLLMLTPTIYMLQVYDRVLVSYSELTLVAVSMICLFLFGIMAIADWARSRVLVRTGLRLDESLGTRIFRASFQSALGSSGPPAARAFGDLIQVRQFLTSQGVFAFFDAPWVPIYIAVTFFLHPFLGWMAVAFALVQLALAWLGHRRTVAPGEAAFKAASEANVYLQGKLRNAEVVEAMGMLGNLRLRWQQRHRDALARNGAAQATVNRVTAWSTFVRHSQQSLSLGAGALLVIDGQLSAGGMIAANLLMNRALAPIDLLVGSWRAWISTRAAFLRLEELLAVNPVPDGRAPDTPPAGDVMLRQVVARAHGRQDAILKGVDLSVPAGTVVAVIGPSGSGKTTLARVVLGIWPEVEGEVLLDGQPVAGRDRDLLGPHLGYLPQDVELFEGSIADNIARFRKANPALVIDAARLAGLHEAILRFPKGYDTPIGEAGGLLSGGQRQRIGLARAVYGEPALIVLDEPNANLDEAGEQALVAAVARLKERAKTVLLITHRPGIVAAADWLVVLGEGKVVAQGPRDIVMAGLQFPHQSVASSTPPAAAPAGPQTA
ncbi:MAG: type I secretion system permease/ATPase [Comamonadaceae bacterium]|nr:MAG: type I secretion system permease/ATPase [Comamonadaceae bacterium]